VSELLDHVVLRAVFLLNFVLEEFDGILGSCRVEEPGLLQDTDGFVHTTHITEVCARRLVQDILNLFRDHWSIVLIAARKTIVIAHHDHGLRKAFAEDHTSRARTLSRIITLIIK
jgi:hypothetical protein